MLPKLRLPLIVEGRYDKSAVLGMFSGTVITTDGFGIFNSKEKQALIRRIGKDGVILLTDPDAGGKQIRSFISGIVSKEKIYQLYVPRVEGKERRKTHRSKEGVLGVEGVGGDVLRELLMPFTEGEDTLVRADVSVADLYEMGLTGKESSAYLRDRIAISLGLIPGMNAKAFLEALNIVSDRDELLHLVSENNK